MPSPPTPQVPSCHYHPCLEPYGPPFDKYKNLLTVFLPRLHFFSVHPVSILSFQEQGPPVALYCSLDKSRPHSLASSPFTTWSLPAFIQQMFSELGIMEWCLLRLGTYRGRIKYISQSINCVTTNHEILYNCNIHEHS